MATKSQPKVLTREQLEAIRAQLAAHAMAHRKAMPDHHGHIYIAGMYAAVTLALAGAIHHEHLD
jgi:hypothetical protein